MSSQLATILLETPQLNAAYLLKSCSNKIYIILLCYMTSMFGVDKLNWFQQICSNLIYSNHVMHQIRQITHLVIHQTSILLYNTKGYKQESLQKLEEFLTCKPVLTLTQFIND